MAKVAVIWGSGQDAPRFHTHHYFWEAAILEKGLEFVRFTWKNWEEIPKGMFDLHFFVDFHPSLFRLARHGFKNTAFYWWDSFHYTFVYPAQVSDLFDRAYFAEHTTATVLKAHGYPAAWLPSAFHPGIYHPIPGKQKVHDYAFVGQADGVVERKGDTRASFLAKLGKLPGIHGYIGRGVYADALNGIYNESKVMFDRTIWNNLGTRFFETVGSGGFTLMNRLKGYNGIDLLAADGLHYVSYDDSFGDFERKLLHYLKDDEARERIASAGARHFLERHTFERRLDVILGDFGLL